MMLELSSAKSQGQCEGNSRDHKQSRFWSNTRIKRVQIPLLDKNGIIHSLRHRQWGTWFQLLPPTPNNHCTRASSLQNNGNVRSPSCSVAPPPPLPLSPWMSCHLSMKECQAFSQSDWQFLLFRFSGYFKRVVMCYQKNYPLWQAVFRLPPMVNHLPVSIMYKEIYD